MISITLYTSLRGSKEVGLDQRRVGASSKERLARLAVLSPSLLSSTKKICVAPNPAAVVSNSEDNDHSSPVQQ
jgi:hypothetical protein